MDPGSGIGKNPGSFYRELRNNFWVKILKFFDVDADPGIFLTLSQGSGMEKFGSGINIPDPQHWSGVSITCARACPVQP
jgi:hypothetical protein